MIFNRHSNIEGQHAFLSPSKYNWTNYDDEKLVTSYMNWLNVQRGTRLHAFAAEAIRLGMKLPRNKQTVNAFVNDAIGFGMTPEQPLYYSENAFGTTDAIGFKNGMLRIHDLKTGRIKASFRQLEVYQALFCLEYDVDPASIESELRIYQYDDMVSENPDPSEILEIMDKIIVFDNRIAELREGSG